MNPRIIGALVSKDLSLFFRKKGILAITVLGLVFYLIIYFVLPDTVSETLKIGVYGPGLPPVFEQLPEEGLEVTVVDSEEELKDSVAEGDYIAGIVLPEDLLNKLNSGDQPEVRLYFTPDAPEEIETAMKTLVNEMAYLITGETLNVDITQEVLGQDLLGTPVSPRDRMRPLIAVMIIFMEMLGLANLLTEEVERRTAQALLVTPATVIDVFTAKSIAGIGLAFVQAVLVMIIVGGMNINPILILVALLLGAVLVTGLSFLISAFARDFLSVLAWSVPFLVILFIPALGVLIPGAITGWVKIIPSYYLVDTIHRVANYGSGWGDVWGSLMILLGFAAVIIAAGILILRRKLQ
ncbi:MAG: ABC transporter permease [Dehalococcoidia bacterium]|jgi:ABC-2 type transport system permease protein